MAWKPSEKEEEYFARIEFERRKKLEEEKHRNIVKIWTDVKVSVEKSLKDITKPGQDLYTMIDS